MTDTLVNSNVIIDVLVEDAQWLDWSRRAIAEACADGKAVINQIVLAELSVGIPDDLDVNDIMPMRLLHRENLPWEAAHLAGRAYLEYRRQGGLRRSPLPDFYLGAHAAVGGYRLLTRDSNRFRTYFPTVEVIAPDTHP